MKGGSTFLLYCTCFFLFFEGMSVAGGIYSYVDKNGVWHFTNVPNSPKFTRIEMDESHVSIIGGSDSRCGVKGNVKASLDEIVEQAAAKFDLDPDLIRAIILAESGGNPNAVSPKGALGLMQLMPGTAKELKVGDPFDPAENIHGGSKYLSELLKAYNGDILNALAAYNAGPSTVSKYNGIPPYPETVSYIKRVLKYWQRIKNN